MILPDAMTPAMRDALGFMALATGPIAHVLRAGGWEIAHTAEDEQATVFLWFLKLAIEHGDQWKEIAAIELSLIAVMTA